MTPPDWAEPLFRRIARPRLPGSPAVTAVQEEIVRRLEASGYAVERQAFAATPHRLAAAMLAGAGLGWVALLSAPLLLVPVPAWPVTLSGIAALAFVALLAMGLASGRLPFSGQAVRAVNLVARRGSPRVWLVAHSDSKAQPLSLGVRVVASATAALGATLLAAALLVRLTGPVAPWLAGLACGPAVLGGAALSLGRARDCSPGAVDNATGVIAVLVGAERLGARDDVGVLITDAEEFGMEGARAWVAAAGGRMAGWFVNFDGLDDRGRFRVMRHGRAGAALAQAVAAALRAEGERVAVAPLPPGVLVDGLPLARAGLRGVTVSRGDWRTLALVHTSRDAAERVTVASAVRAGEAVAAAVRVLDSVAPDL